MLQVKMCGMTRPDDVHEAVRLGVDAIGLVFHPPSPRSVTRKQATHIVEDLPPEVATVGVFVNAPQKLVVDTVRELNLTAVQLHGDEPPEYVVALRARVPTIKALAFGPDLVSRLRPYTDGAVLIDAAAGTRRGGVGKTWDWSAWDGSIRPAYLIVAGGLTPMNVNEAIEQLHPDAVDVASGIESTPGIKDHDLMAAFMTACAPYRTERRAFMK